MVDRLFLQTNWRAAPNTLLRHHFVQATTQTGVRRNIRSLLARIDSAKAPVGLR